MIDYDYTRLSPFEFESLSRDIIQKITKEHFESFSEGKDGAIDFRCIKSNKNTIIQCKRYKNFISLFNNLKKEVKKIKKYKLEISEYYLTVPIDLTKDNKSKIIQLYSEIINLPEQNIITKKDISNYLQQFNDIENNYFKLWLPSYNVLYETLKSRIKNRSEIKLENINRLTKLYVQNKSFNEALKILKQNNFIIISGVPGIGKTTLGNMLVTYCLMKNDYDEFIDISTDIDEAFEIYKKHKKQVFYYDDFLGRINFNENTLTKNEDVRLLDFIKKVKTTKNKIFICTTREYVLNQAKQLYERFESMDKDNKLILELGLYSKKVKAEILYNHLFFNQVPEKYVMQIVKDKTYKKIINHRNYNPRSVETITSKEFLENISEENFIDKFLYHLENPFEIWEKAFENHINAESRIILLNMALMSENRMLNYEKLYMATAEYFKTHTNKVFNQIDFDKCLKELMNCFIICEKKSGKIFIDFQNPSINDFLIYYLNGHVFLLQNLIQSAPFIEQLYLNITTNKKNKHKIRVNDKILNIIEDKVINNFFSAEPIGLGRNYVIEIRTLSGLYEGGSEKINNFIGNNYKAIISNNIYRNNIYTFISLLDLYNEIVNLSKDSELLQLIHNKLRDIDDYADIDSLFDFFDEEIVDKFLDENDIRDKLDSLIEDEYDSSSDVDELKHLQSKVEGLRYGYGDFTTYLDKIYRKIKKIESEEEEEEESFEEHKVSLNEAVQEDKLIDEMFATLLK